MASFDNADCEKTQAPLDDVAVGEIWRLKQAKEKMAEYSTQCSGPRPMSSADVLTELFSYHPPTVNTLPKFAAINQAAKNFAEVILQNCPPSADRSDAIRKIREARMTANAAVALNGLSL